MEYGRWAFIIGVLLAIVAGLIPSLQTQPWLVWVLAVLGLVVGFLNVTDKESTGFLVAAIALMGVGNAGTNVFTSYTNISTMLSNIQAFVAPGALVVALKAVYAISAER